MTSSTVSVKTYTDTPDLHPNLILGSLQLLFWLFFHPSAWRNYVARLDPTLRPDFALAELRPEQWRNPALRRLLLMGYVILPVSTGLLVGLVPWWWVIEISNQEIVFNVLASVTYGLLAGVAIGLTANVAVSVAYGAVMSLIIGLAPPTLLNRMAYGVVISSLIGGTPDPVGGVVHGLLFGLAASMAGSVAVSIAKQRHSYPLIRQVSGFIAGVLISALLLAAGYIVASGVVFGPLVTGPIDHPLGLVAGVVLGLGGGVLFGISYALTVRVRTRNWFRGVASGIAGGLSGGVAYGLAAGLGSDIWVYYVALGMGGGLMFGALFALSYVLAERVAGAWAGAMAGALVSGVAWAPLQPFIFPDIPLWPTLPLVLIIVLLGLGRTWLQPAALYPILAVWNFLLFRLDERRTGHQPRLLRLHSAFWDEHQRLPLFGLDEHLVLAVEHNPVRGQAAIDYLTTSRQHWAARAAQIELEARWLESCTDVEAIGSVHRSLGAGELAGPASALLRSFSRVSQDVLAALRQESAYNQRLALSAVEDRLDGLLRELTRSSERYAARFRPIASRWRRVVTDHGRELAAAVELRQEIDSPYVIGVPLTGQQEIFVGRTDISARIEQLLLDRRSPPLLLYGQRRMGKTSLLNNLGRLLPSTLIPLFVDLQGPASQANSQAGFLYNLARGMISSAQRQRGLVLPPLSHETLAADPFTGFDEWLDRVESVLGQDTALLALDEFESLEAPIAEGRFSETAIMGMFRHLIQHRPRFKVLLTGSHSIDEFERWAGYLINVQMIHISYLSQAEARQLIERPVKNFALRYEPEASRRVLDLTRGHPFMVQLLCSEILALKNEQDPAVRRLARLSDVAEAAPQALTHGSFFFADIQRNQVNAAGLALLRFLAAQGEGAVVARQDLARQVEHDLDQTLAHLLRRELIESVDGGYRFQVELIRRWFARA